MSWQFLLAAREIVVQTGSNKTESSKRALHYDSDVGVIVRTEFPNNNSCLWLDEKAGWCRKSDLPSVCHALFDLYLPVLGTVSGVSRIIAHLGQSIDARIATVSGDSFYVTGEENRKHLHCLRALSDAVVVGCGTVIADDPQLTTRAVPGDNAVRVVLDPRARLTGPLQVFNDGLAHTVLVHQSSASLSNREMNFGPQITDQAGCACRQVERVIVPDSDEQLLVSQIIDSLSKLGLHRLFVEGGGITVSRFFEHRVLDRLHVAVAPLLVGEGVEALQINGVENMMLAHRPPHAIYRMGDDVLWDFDVSNLKEGFSVAPIPDENASNKSEKIQPPCRSIERIV